MGIKRLYGLLTIFSNELYEQNKNTTLRPITKINFNKYKNKLIAIDATQKLYSYGIAIRKNGNDMLDIYGNITNHMYAIYSYTLMLIDMGIKPFYVFDGKQPIEKKNTLFNRKQKRLIANKICDDIEDKTTDEYIKNYKKSYFIIKQNIKDCTIFLNACGFPYIESIGEADSQCAALTTNNNFYGVITEDIDTLVFGSKIILKDFTRKSKGATEILHTDILETLRLRANNIFEKYGLTERLSTFTNINFIEFVSLFDNDYSSGIKFITRELLFEYFIINNMDVSKLIIYLEENIYNIKENNKYHIPIDFIDNWSKTCKYYKETKVISPDKISIEFNKPNNDIIFNILYSKCNFNLDDVNNFIDKINVFYETIILNN